MRFKGANGTFLKSYLNHFLNVLSGGVRTGKTTVAAMAFCDTVVESDERDVFALGSQSKATMSIVVFEALREYNPDINIQEKNNGTYIIEGRKVMPYYYSDKLGGKKKQGGTIKLAWCDEAHSMPESVYNDLFSRLSRPDSKMILTNNPEGATHWLYRNFISGAELINGRYFKRHLSENRTSMVYPSTVTEYRASNGGHINDDYVDSLIDQLPLITKKRLIDGEWIDSIGKIFDKTRLKYYNIDELPNGSNYALIDPAFGQENCFTSCIIYRKHNNKYYIVDSGLLRSNAIDTVDEVITRFLATYSVASVKIEANFGQGELAKRLERTFNTTKFYVNENKIKRITDQSINIRDNVLFPEDWQRVPDGSYEKWLDTPHGRGYIGLSQLLNFSDDNKENCIKGQDMTYIDFPDALTSILKYDKINSSEVVLEENRIARVINRNEFA